MKKFFAALLVALCGTVPLFAADVDVDKITKAIELYSGDAAVMLYKDWKVNKPSTNFSGRIISEHTNEFLNAFILPELSERGLLAEWLEWLHSEELWKARHQIVCAEEHKELKRGYRAYYNTLDKYPRLRAWRFSPETDRKYQEWYAILQQKLGNR